MGATLDVMDGVGVGVDLVVVGVVVEEGDVGLDHAGLVFGGGGFTGKFDDLFVEGFLVLVKEEDVLGYPVVKLVMGLLRMAVPLVLDVDGNAGVEEGQFAEALSEDVVFEVEGLGENLRVWLEGDLSTSVVTIADDHHLLGGDPAGKFHLVDLAFPAYLGLEPFGYGVGTLRTDAVEPPRNGVCAFAELPPCMEVGKDEFEGRDAVFGVDVDRDAPAIVGHGTRAVPVDGHKNLGAIPGERLVDGVVDNLEYAVVEPAFGGVADIHVGPLPDPCEALEFLDLGGVIDFFLLGRVILRVIGCGFVAHLRLCKCAGEAGVCRFRQKERGYNFPLRGSQGDGGDFQGCDGKD